MKLINRSKAPDQFGELKSNEKTMAMLIWLLSVITGIIAPLLIWLLQKDESRFINKQGKNFFNYYISYFIYFSGGTILAFVNAFFIPLNENNFALQLIFVILTLIITVIILVLSVLVVVCTICACVTVYKGKDYVFPFSITFIK